MCGKFRNQVGARYEEATLEVIGNHVEKGCRSKITEEKIDYVQKIMGRPVYKGGE